MKASKKLSKRSIWDRLGTAIGNLDKIVEALGKLDWDDILDVAMVFVDIFGAAFGGPFYIAARVIKALYDAYKIVQDIVDGFNFFSDLSAQFADLVTKLGKFTSVSGILDFFIDLLINGADSIFESFKTPLKALAGFVESDKGGKFVKRIKRFLSPVVSLLRTVVGFGDKIEDAVGKLRFKILASKWGRVVATLFKFIKDGNPVEKIETEVRGMVGKIRTWFDTYFSPAGLIKKITGELEGFAKTLINKAIGFVIDFVFDNLPKILGGGLGRLIGVITSNETVRNAVKDKVRDFANSSEKLKQPMAAAKGFVAEKLMGLLNWLGVTPMLTTVHSVAVGVLDGLPTEFIRVIKGMLGIQPKLDGGSGENSVADSLVVGAQGQGTFTDHVQSSYGSPLPGAVALSMSHALGYDVTDTFVHNDAAAAAASAAIGARAFTLHGEVYFGSGEYAPHTREGQWLLAHELAHVGQQKGTGPHEHHVTPIGLLPPASGTLNESLRGALSAMAKPRGAGSSASRAEVAADRAADRSMDRLSGSHASPRAVGYADRDEPHLAPNDPTFLLTRMIVINNQLAEKWERLVSEVGKKASTPEAFASALVARQDFTNLLGPFFRQKTVFIQRLQGEIQNVEKALGEAGGGASKAARTALATRLGRMKQDDTQAATRAVSMSSLNWKRLQVLFGLASLLRYVRGRKSKIPASALKASSFKAACTTILNAAQRNTTIFGKQATTPFQIVTSGKDIVLRHTPDKPSNSPAQWTRYQKHIGGSGGLKAYEWDRRYDAGQRWYKSKKTGAASWVADRPNVTKALKDHGDQIAKIIRASARGQVIHAVVYSAITGSKVSDYLSNLNATQQARLKTIMGSEYSTFISHSIMLITPTTLVRRLFDYRKHLGKSQIPSEDHHIAALYLGGGHGKSNIYRFSGSAVTHHSELHGLMKAMKISSKTLWASVSPSNRKLMGAVIDKGSGDLKYIPLP